jgi:hypothetical protein
VVWLSSRMVLRECTDSVLFQKSTVDSWTRNDTYNIPFQNPHAALSSLVRATTRNVSSSISVFESTSSRVSRLREAALLTLPAQGQN